MTKKTPEFMEIYEFNIEKINNTLILPRYSNDGKTIKYEHFIKKANEHAGKGSYGTGYLSLGVQQTDENGKPLKDLNGEFILKKETRNGGFARFIKEFASAAETFKQFYPGKNYAENKLAFDKWYENRLLNYARNTYHNGHLGAKDIIKDQQTGNYYLIMHAIKGIELQKYMAENTVEPHDKIIIAKNIALANQFDADNSVIHDDYKPENFILNPETLGIRAIDYDLSNKMGEDGTAISEVGTIAFGAHEKLNTPKNQKTIVTKKSDVYSAVASIVDTVTGLSPKTLFEIKKASVNLGYNTNNPLYELRYFGNYSVQTPTIHFSQRNFNGIAMCCASLDRILALKQEIDKPSYLLSPKTKEQLVQLCARGLAIDPEIRPTSAELSEIMEHIASEFHINYFHQVISASFIQTLNDMRKKYPNIMQSEAIQSLILKLERMSHKEKISADAISDFKLQLSSALSVIEVENDLPWFTYLNNIKTKISLLEIKIAAGQFLPAVHENIQVLKLTQAKFSMLSNEQKIEGFDKFQQDIVRLITELDQKRAKPIYSLFFKQKQPLLPQAQAILDTITNKADFIKTYTSEKNIYK
ncbi:MAG: hypothetical protein HKM04_03990 [Legionellales bacterium]|nr:hypothetical protein [Legionellales bacterium]